MITNDVIYKEKESRNSEQSENRSKCPNPKGELGICYSFDRHGDRCGCVECPLLDTLPNGMFNEGDPLPGLTSMLKEYKNETNS